MIGRTLSHFEITAKLGEGGMGEVYRATDTKLGREVAIKILPPVFTQDEERLGRFEREARVLAALDHPNIAGIYEVGHDDGTHYLAMQLAEGEDLAERISRGPIPVAEAIPIARQIAEALEAAHESGVVHRDLKPANVKVTVEGAVRVLDFGLAKAWEGDAASGSSLMARSPTLAAGMTEPGVLLGTAAYMSPEQARGLSVDKRSDIWAFGAVLAEMLTGRKVFPGETVTDVLASIVRSEPELSSLPPDLPSPVAALIERCLQKDVNRRLRDIGEARIALENASSDRTMAGVSAAPAPSLAGRPDTVRRARFGPAVLLVVGLGLGAALAWILRGEPGSSGAGTEPLRKVSIALPQGVELEIGAGPGLAISDDGSLLAFIGRSQATGERSLYLRPLSERDARRIPDTEDARNPFFSPDGQWIGYATSLELRKAAVTGGGSFKLASLANNWGSDWLGDGTIVYSDVRVNGESLFEVPAEGGVPRLLSTADFSKGEQEHSVPWALPGERTLVVTMWSGGFYSRAGIGALPRDGGDARRILDGGSHAAYLPSGHLVYARGAEILAAPFDLEALRTTGPPAGLVTGVLTEPVYGEPHLALSRGGVLAYARGAAIAPSRLVWVGRDGQEVINEELPARNPRISRDGRRIAFLAPDSENSDIWLLDPATGQLTRFTTGESEESFPVWGHDGSTLFFHDWGNQGIFAQRMGSDQQELLMAAEGPMTFPHSVSHDGRWLAINSRGLDDGAGSVGRSILALGLGEESGEKLTLAEEGANPLNPRFSPVGPWMAYQSERTRRSEVWLRPFPFSETETPVQISRQGGSAPFWSRDGRTVYYKSGRKLMAADVTTSAEMSVGEPREILELGDLIAYDTGRDGRFLAVAPPDYPPVTRIELIFGWMRELQDRVPAGR